MQRNWIGRSEGATLRFPVDVEGVDESLSVFTTRPDTVYGATFMVLAPEHDLVERITTNEQRETVEAYVAATSRVTEIERLSAEREKTGVFTGAYAINPFNGARIPIWIADYVLVTYGTGAIMAVPAHDERDFAFARDHGLDVIPVFDHPQIDVSTPLEAAFTQGGAMINSGAFDGTPANEAIAAVTAHAEAEGSGAGAVTYRLRDWLISRQRYWGTPIPMIHCESCGVVPVPENDLPVLLPEDVHFEPAGQSPLTQIDEWVNVACPQCGTGARRETDTLDTFMCSSWYQMRYVDPHNPERPFSSEAGSHWLPVDVYTGGAEHAVMHLLYTRFFWKAARDMGIVEGDEPMKRLFNQGVILGPDGNRMSKSRGNVVAPDELVERYGADAFRCQLMFIGPWDQGGPYNPSGMPGIVRWLNRLWSVATEPPPDGTSDAAAARNLVAATQRTIRDVTSDLEGFRFNTAIARLMELTTALARARDAGGIETATWERSVETLILLIAPLAPTWPRSSGSGGASPTASTSRPGPSSTSPSSSRRRSRSSCRSTAGCETASSFPPMPARTTRANAPSPASASGGWVEGKELRRVIYVPGKLLNIVV